MNVLHKFALSLLKSTGMGKRISLQKKRMKAALSPAYLPLTLVKKETYTQLENAKVELDAPFSKADELAEKEAGLNELNILLNMDQKDRCLMDDTPDEGQNELPKSRDYER